jgi:hypothetical protein
MANCGTLGSDEGKPPPRFMEIGSFNAIFTLNQAKSDRLKDGCGLVNSVPDRL